MLDAKASSSVRQDNELCTLDEPCLSSERADHAAWNPGKSVLEGISAVRCIRERTA